MITIQNIVRETFKPYGSIIEFPYESTENFLIVEEEAQASWRLAVFRYRNKQISKLECHPTSKESFEPLSGFSLLVVAENETPQNYEAFILDKPVCLQKGIWHQVMALTEEAQVKITENLVVESLFYELEYEICVGVSTLLK